MGRGRKIKQQKKNEVRLVYSSKESWNRVHTLVLYCPQTTQDQRQKSSGTVTAVSCNLNSSVSDAKQLHTKVQNQNTSGLSKMEHLVFHVYSLVMRCKWILFKSTNLNQDCLTWGGGSRRRGVLQHWESTVQVAAALETRQWKSWGHPASHSALHIYSTMSCGSRQLCVSGGPKERNRERKRVLELAWGSGGLDSKYSVALSNGTEQESTRGHWDMIAKGNKGVPTNWTGILQLYWL